MTTIIGRARARAAMGVRRILRVLIMTGPLSKLSALVTGVAATPEI
jgi:hypothetical protein